MCRPRNQETIKRFMLLLKHVAFSMSNGIRDVVEVKDITLIMQFLHEKKSTYSSFTINCDSV